MDAKAQRILNIYEDGVSETELTETLKTKINASIGGSLGSIKPTDAAPTPARNGNYTFSIGGNKPAWLTAEAKVTTVKAGDGVAVVYTAPDNYSYTHVDVGGEISINSENIANTQTLDSGTFTLAKGDIKRYDYPLKVGKKIRLTVVGLTVVGTGDYNVRLTDSNGSYIVVKYGQTDQVIDFTITEAATFFTLSFGYNANISSLSAVVRVQYGISVDSSINAANIAVNTVSISTNATNIANSQKLVKAVPIQFINYNVAGITDFIYGTGVYFGYNKPVLKDFLLSSITMFLFSATSSHVGRTWQFVVGTVDQRNWLLPRLIVDCPISSVTSNKATFDFTALKVIINAGEVVFAVSSPVSGTASLGITTSSYDASNQLLTTTSLSNALVAKTTTNATTFQLNLLDIDSVFTTKGAIDAVNTKITALNQKAATINLYSDYINGDKYELKIVNGAIVVQSLEFQRILVIGHSFVNYANSPTADWYLDDGENRAMAASINANQWTTFVKDKFGATLTLKGGVDFERNFSPSYDFATNWNVTNDYDAICVYLNENAVYNSTMQESWEAMLNYLKIAAPNAKIYCTGSWSANTKQQAIQAACNSVSNITYIDLVGLQTVGNYWKRGDYYLGRANTYYPMGAAYGHPNDMGHLAIANYFLLYMAQDQITNNSYTITLNQVVGGIIETPNLVWVENGIVTIRINATSGYAINGLNVVTAGGQAVTVTQRTNNFFDGTNRVYYTFTMPAENIVVTPTWIAI